MVRGLIAYFVGHRTAANILLVLMLALGFGASLQLRAQFFPDVVVENVRVSIQWEGASPRDMDTAVVAVIEPAVAAVEGAEGTLSTSREGEASIRVDFEPGWDMARAVSDVETAVGQILRNLPEGADDPVITRGAWRDRVTDVIISGPVGIEQLTRYSDQFQGLLYREGITRTTVSGVVAPEITVTLQELDLIRHGLTLSDVSGAIAGEVEALPAGDVGDQARLRTGEDRRAADAIAAIPVLVRADGEVLTIGDVATVIDAPLNRDEAYFTGEDPAISIRVDRSAEGDAIAIQQTVQRVADELEATLPQGVTVTLIRTRAEAISDRLDILLSNGLMGLGLVLALLFLFLSPRTAFWVAAGIPVAMTAALALMFAFGLTLNMISLFALIITLGIVVDDAIVVGEHADFRHRSLRETPQEAAGNAAQVMAAPVFSATVTTVIAFSALAVISGRFGELIADIPFTVAVVLIASLVECFLILPNHMRHALAGKDRAAGFSVLRLFGALTVLPVAAGLLFASLASLRFDTVGPMALIGERWDILPFIDAGFVWVGWPFALAAIAAAAIGLLALVASSARARRALGGQWFDAPSALVNRGFRSVRDRAFRPFMKLVVLARYPVLALAVLSLAGAVSMFRDGDVTWRFFNNPEETSVSGNIAMLPGATRADTRAMVRELERATLAVAERIVEETGTDPIAFVMTTVGATTGRGLSGEGAKDPDQLGSITIELIDADLRSVSSREIVRRIENEVSRAALLETLSFRSWGSGPGGDNLDVAFYGADIAVLKRAAEAFIARMERIPEVSGLEDSLPYDSTELSLQLTPLGQALGFDIEELGRVLRNRLAGIEAARFPDGVRTATVRVELRAEDRAADFLERTRVRNPDGGWLSLSEIVTVEERAGFASIRRIDGLATVSVTGEISEDDPERAAAVTATMRETILPAIAAEFAVSYEEQGLAEQERAFLSEALVGFVLCLIGIYITLAWIFSGWFRPIVVMSVIPFGLVGTIWGHWLWDVPLSMFTVVGLIGMTGIIINDSIVLITTIQEKAKTRALVPAVIDGTADRLRAVLLTTLTTVMGLSPLLYETSQQAQFLRPTVITLVYGLGFGMVLVLLVVPALVVVQRDIAIAIRAARRMISARRAPSVIRIVSIGAALASAVVVFVTLGPGLVPALPVLTLGMPPVAAMIAGVLVVNLAAFVVAAALGPRQQP